MSKNIQKIVLTLLLTTLILLGCGKTKDENQSVFSSDIGESNMGVTVGELEANTSTDVVLVMDESGSMLNADKERIAIEGAKLFVDMEKNSNANIGLVEFSNELKTTDLVDVSQQENKAMLKSILENVTYGSKAHTDTGAALLEAIQLLQNSGDKSNKSVILFTDGRTDIDAGTPGRTLEDSLNDVDTAVQQAKENGYEIYCIGLNENGSVDEAELSTIAEQTGGGYLIATNVSEITDFFERIFAQIDDSDVEMLDEYVADGEYHTVYFDIDNENVLEANIVILSSKEIEDVILKDTDGNTVDIENDQRITFSKSAKYTMIKIQNPDVGQWCVSVKGINGDAIKIGRIFSYDLNLIVEVRQTKVSVGNGHWYIMVYFSSDGQKVIDNDFYNSLSGSVFITDAESGAVYESPLTSRTFSSADGDVNFLVCEPEFDHQGEYSMKVLVKGNGFYRESDTITLYGVKNKATVIKEMSEIVLKKGKEYEINLDEYFQDEDGEDIKYYVESRSENIQVNVDGSDVTLLCDEKGKSQLKISADNGSAQCTYRIVDVVCRDPADTVRNVIIAGAIIAVVVLLITWIRKSKELIDGTFKVSVVSCSEDENGVSKIETYNIPNIITAESIGKHGFQLTTLLKLISDYYMEQDAEKKARFHNSLERFKAVSDKVSVRGSKDSFEIRIINKSPDVKFIENEILISEKKVLTVSLSNGVIGGIPILEKKFGIRFFIKDTNDYEQVNIVYRKI
jgi:Mg-chelatase subunit ChlD